MWLCSSRVKVISRFFCSICVLIAIVVLFLITLVLSLRCVFFFFNDPAPTKFSPLPLHDVLPISQFLDEAALKALQSTTVGRYGGLGIEVNLEDGLIKAITPMDDAPAARAGILSGDKIYRVDDTEIGRAHV